jgi:putative hydrolase of the HAD superfamily
MKPDARIFERTLTRLEREAGETVFVDDFAHNIAGAKAVGMAGVHYPHTETNVPASFAKLGIA